MVRPLHIRGAHVWSGKETTVGDIFAGKEPVLRDLCTNVNRIVDAPIVDSQMIDLDGYSIFPGFVNAHDHLELNHYPRSKFRERYDNARQWHEDMNARLNDEPYKSLRAYPLWDKLFIGGLKNLLCGATTVAHHNPPHKDLWHKDFPVRVLKNYGWAHSFYLSTDEEIQRSYRSTPKDWPWFIHLAEGADEVAGSEYRRLKALGCIGKNTVLVHGVGMTEEDIDDATTVPVKGHVVCPTTNQYLLDKLPNLDAWADALNFYHFSYGACLAPGSDSRLTAEGDLLQELHSVNFPPPFAGAIAAAYVLGIQEDTGHLKKGAHADWVVIRNTSSQFPYMAFSNSRRADLALVVKGGVPQIGDPELMAKFTDNKIVDATLDGKPKAIHIELAKRIHANALKEHGLEVDSVPKRKLFQFI